ncbi:MAG: ATP-binding cassette domain-containing protein [Clostridia bacterium]|nr:ATP-binding cassette domain-containing protein [Clostridia bacterium]
MDYVIETRSLTKKYGERAVVNQVSVHVKKGDIYGLIGKNGAGKTTLMRLILGLAVPSSGEVKLFGGERADLSRRKIGSLIEAPALFKSETALENMKRFALLAPTTDDEIKRLLEFVGLGDTGTKKAGAFSLGMKQRLGIAIALLGNPEILILDEPINGLDPAGIKEIRDTIMDLNAKGITFMISSHILDELGKIATNYGIMNDGILEEISAEELKKNCRSSLKVVTDDGERASDVLRAQFPELNFTVKDGVLEISSEVKDASLLNKSLVGAGVGVYELTNEKIEFEDYFIGRLGK